MYTPTTFLAAKLFLTMPITQIQVVIITALTGLLVCSESHTIIPVNKWPLTSVSADMDVMTGEHSAYLSKTDYEEGNPVFGYKAYKLSDTASVRVNLTARKKYTIIVYLFFSYKDNLMLLSVQDLNGQTVVRVHVDNRCSLYISSPKGNKNNECKIPDISCLKTRVWHVIYASVKYDTISVTLFLSLDTELRPAKYVSCSLKMITDSLSGPGSLWMGYASPPLTDTPSVLKGRAFCLQIYDETFDSDHVEEQVRSVCSQLYIDACSIKPCFNGGHCVSQGPIYSCRCTPLFTGASCESELWVRNRGFRHSSDGVPNDVKALSEHGTRSRIECSALCLKENSCWSFSLRRSNNPGDNICTLYDGIGSHFQESLDTKYYIPA